MYVGIVGSSKAPITEGNIKFVENIIKDYDKMTTVIVSGGAKGVDTLAKLASERLNYKFVAFSPTAENWEAYKKRNLEIAKECNIVISVALPYSGNRCYHCNSTLHDKTAGCWTARKCKKYIIRVLKNDNS